jgi:hypothetical protein
MTVHNQKCSACKEENKLGSTQCARCGATMEVLASDLYDPELANFVGANGPGAEVPWRF